MQRYGWVFKLNILILALLLVVFAIAKVQSPSFNNFISSLLGAPSTPTESQDAGR